MPLSASATGRSLLARHRVDKCNYCIDERTQLITLTPPSAMKTCKSPALVANRASVNEAIFRQPPTLRTRYRSVDRRRQTTPRARCPYSARREGPAEADARNQLLNRTLPLVAWSCAFRAAICIIQ